MHDMTLNILTEWARETVVVAASNGKPEDSTRLILQGIPTAPGQAPLWKVQYQKEDGVWKDAATCADFHTALTEYGRISDSTREYMNEWVKSDRLVAASKTARNRSVQRLVVEGYPRNASEDPCFKVEKRNADGGPWVLVTATESLAGAVAAYCEE